MGLRVDDLFYDLHNILIFVRLLGLRYVIVNGGWCVYKGGYRYAGGVEKVAFAPIVYFSVSSKMNIE